MLYSTAAGTVSGKVYRSAFKMRIDCLVRAWQLPRICGPNPASANDGPGALTMHLHPDVAMDRFLTIHINIRRSASFDLA